MTKNKAFLIVLIIATLAILSIAIYKFKPLDFDDNDLLIRTEITSAFENGFSQIIGHDIKISEIFIHSEHQEFTLENVQFFTVHNNEVPLFSLQEISGAVPKITDEEIVFEDLTGSGFKFNRSFLTPFDSSKNLFDGDQSLNSHILGHFFELEQIMSTAESLYPLRIERKIANLSQLYRAYMAQDNQSEQTEIEKKIESLLEDPIILDVSDLIEKDILPLAIRNETNHEEIIFALLRPFIKQQFDHFITWFRHSREKYIDRSQREHVKHLKIKSLLINESNQPVAETSLVGGVRNIGMDKHIESPLSIKVQGDSERHSLRGLDFGVNINDGKETGVILKLNILKKELKDIPIYVEPEIELSIIESIVSAKTLSFALENQTTGSYKLNFDKLGIHYSGDSDFIKYLLGQLEPQLALDTAFTYFQDEGFSNFKIRPQEISFSEDENETIKDMVLEELNLYINSHIQKNEEIMEPYNNYVDFYIERLKKFQDAREKD